MISMRRRLPIATALFVAFAFTLPAWGVEVAVLKSKDIALYNTALSGFQSTFSGKITVHDMAGDPATGQAKMREITSQGPDLIVAIGDKAAQVAKTQNSQNIPLLHCMVLTPERYNLEGDRVVGISINIPPDKQLRFLKEISPGVASVGVVYDPKKTGPLVEQAKQQSSALGVKLIAVPVGSTNEVPKAVRQVMGQADAFWLLSDNTVINKETFKLILLASFERNVPLLAFSDKFVKVGALASLSPDYQAIGRQAGQLASKIVQGGAMPGAPLVPPTEVKLAINRTTAQKIGLAIPDAVIKRAHQVF